MTELAPPPSVPAPLAGDLAAGETVLSVLSARLAPSPMAAEAIPGVVVLTTERLALVPGTGEPEQRRLRDPVTAVLHDLWSLVKPAVLEAWPTAFLFASRQAKPNALAGRGRPAIEVPLQLVRRPFLYGSRPGWVGIEISLPPPDPRPPFALYIEVGLQAPDLVDAIERHRSDAPPRPEIERPYGLYYLFRPPPQVYVRVEKDRKGLLELGADGPTLRRGHRVDVIVPYESVTAVEIAPETSWRRGEVRLCLEDTEIALRSSRVAHPRLLDVGRLTAEVAGAPLRVRRGKVAGGRIAWRVGWIGAAGAAAWELARILLLGA